MYRSQSPNRGTPNSSSGYNYSQQARQQIHTMGRNSQPRDSYYEDTYTHQQQQRPEGYEDPRYNSGGGSARREPSVNRGGPPQAALPQPRQQQQQQQHQQGHNELIASLFDLIQHQQQSIDQLQRSFDSFRRETMTQFELLQTELKNATRSGGGGGSPSSGQHAMSGLRVDPNVRYCNLCDVTYNQQITLEHVEGKRHKQHILRLLEGGHYEELRRQREIAERANASTPENLYGPAPNGSGRGGGGGWSGYPSGDAYNSPPPNQQHRQPSPRQGRPPLLDPSYGY